MEQAEILAKIKDIIVDLLEVEPEKVKLDARFREDLEADSLDLVELIMEFEEQFGSDISDDDAQTIKTVGQAVDYVKKHMPAS